MGSRAKAHKESVRGDGTALDLGCGGSCTAMCQNSQHVTPKTHPSLPKPVVAGSQPHDKPKEREERWQKGTSGKGTKKQNIQGQCLGKGFGDCYLYMELTRSRELNLLSFLKKLYSQRKKKPGLKKPWVV